MTSESMIEKMFELIPELGSGDQVLVIGRTSYDTRRLINSFVDILTHKGYDYVHNRHGSFVSVCFGKNRFSFTCLVNIGESVTPVDRSDRFRGRRFREIFVDRSARCFIE